MGEAKRRKRYQQQTGQDWPRPKAATLNASTSVPSTLEKTSVPGCETEWFGGLPSQPMTWHGNIFDPHGRPRIPEHELDEQTRYVLEETRAVYGEVVAVRNPDGTASVLANQDS